MVGGLLQLNSSPTGSFHDIDLEESAWQAWHFSPPLASARIFGQARLFRFEESALKRQRAATEGFDAALLDAALLCARRCGARAEDAEDLAQEALLKLLTYGRTIEQPVAWLFVVIRRLHLRRLQNLHASGRLPAAGPSSFDPWPGVELRIDARRLLERVSSRNRASLWLSFAGYSERETAERIGCSVQTTEKSLHRTRSQLRRMLAAQ